MVYGHVSLSRRLVDILRWLCDVERDDAIYQHTVFMCENMNGVARKLEIKLIQQVL